MSTIHGLPAHVLLVHLVVVFAPVSALLAALCAVWPAARRRLVWLLTALVATTMVLTPVTTEAGEWLERHIAPSPLLEIHTQLGDTMLYVAIALCFAALLVVLLHLRDVRGADLNRAAAAVMAAVVLVIAAGAMVQVYRIGDSGAQSAWGDALSGS